MDLNHIILKEEIIADVENNNQTSVNFDTYVKTDVDDDYIGSYYVIKEECYDKLNDAIFFEDLNEFCWQKCDICNLFCPNRYKLLQHNLCHISVQVADFPKFYQCDHCSKYFKTKLKLTKHIRTHSKDSSKETLRNGIVTKSLWRCNICNKIYKYKRWHEHMENIHGKETRCTICNKSFKCQRYLKRHIMYVHEGIARPGYSKSHNTTEEFQCDQCPKKFKSRICINLHKKNCHNQSVECEICKSKLKSQSYLNTHMKRVHYNDGKVHKCKLCPKGFKSPRYLSVHMKNSHSSKELCEWCGKAYTKSYLITHKQNCFVNKYMKTGVSLE